MLFFLGKIKKYLFLERESQIIFYFLQVENVLNAEERALEREAKKGMNEDEAVFSVESALEQTYEWSDKYRPRKPRSAALLGLAASGG